MQAGRSFGLDGAEVEVLARAAEYLPLDEPKNNDSLVMRPWYGQRSFLLSGDVEPSIERCVRPMY
jgi:beta-lactamase superfamily II metal-dependent hydrolase